ncbi:hypothetical protein A5707_18570 [Mycobacterium kyorinense]|uniref:Uncharacterized protein n=1 Tax=Mycobacterium kyorinense TaxID=487514 RepID=A0A1A2ZBR7_9MYCO|nr:hypothetical protein A5707_18570 [Mycobacterium kyorinense]
MTAQHELLLCIGWDTVAIASAAEPGAAGRHAASLVAIASAAEPGAAGRTRQALLSVEPVISG